MVELNIGHSIIADAVFVGLAKAVRDMKNAMRGKKMTLGCGIDIIEIDRIKKAIERWGEHFLKHIFNEEEISYAEKFKNPAPHYAARFAAKEAVYKAIGNHPQMSWKDMTIKNG